MAFDYHQFPVLVVDDEPDILRSFRYNYGEDFDVLTAESGARGLDLLAAHDVAVIVADQRMPSMSGTEFLERSMDVRPDAIRIILTGFTDVDALIHAVNLSRIYRYVTKPWSSEELRLTLLRAIEAFQLGRENARLVEELRRANERLAVENAYLRDSVTAPTDIVGVSPAIQKVLQLIAQVAPSPSTVLISGETGTGKELVARAIHAASPRRDKSFVVIACKDRQRDLLEAELLGSDFHESALQRAQGGSLLLDEIGELPFDLQVALAREISQHSLPSSSAPDLKSTTLHTNARIICTTSSDLQTLAHSGAFFRELLDQINILPIEIPPLGRRREDIPLLVSHFLEQATEAGGQKKIYSPQAIELLATTDWPGNVRQLFELVKQHVALSQGKLMNKEFVQQSLGPQSPSMPAYNEARDQFAHDFLAANLLRAGGNVSKAARLAKRNRSDFYKLLERYRVQAHDIKEGSAHRTEGEEES